MTNIYLATLALAACLLGGCNGEKPMNGPVSGNASEGTPPTHALLVKAKEASGCLLSQTLVADHTKALAKGEAVNAVLERKAAEDVSEETSMVLAFPAGAWGAAEGFLVARVSVESPDGRPPRFELSQARLSEKAGKPSLAIDGSGTGTLRVSFLYSRTPALVKAWFSCPEAGVGEPQPLSFFPAYEFSGMDASTVRLPLGKESRFSVPIAEVVTAGLARLDAALRVLQSVAKGLRVEDSLYVFDRKKLTVDSLKKLATAAGAGRNVQVAVRTDGGEEILAGEPLFDPTLRQKIALRNAGGKLEGAELRIAVE